MSASPAGAPPVIPPGLPPPPGVVPNFVNPYSIIPSLKGVNILFIILVTLTTLVRTYTRFFLIKSYGWSDYTMILAWLAFIPFFVVSWSAYQYGAGVHQWDVPITELISFAKTGYIFEGIYHPLIATTKISICLQFINIFTPDRGGKFWTIVAFMVINTSYLMACFFLSIFQCDPRAKAWNPLLPGKCLNYDHFIISTGVFNMVSDLLMLLFPLFCILNLQMSRDRKFGISAVFFVGILALAASILRLVFSVKNEGSLDQTFTLTQVAECAIGEVTAGILVGNLVCLPRFFKTYYPKFMSLLTLYSRGSRSSKAAHDSENSSGARKHTPKSESTEYLELKDQPYRPAFPQTYSNPTKHAANRTVVGSPQKTQTFLNEGDNEGDRNGVWRSVRVEQSVDHV